MSFFLQRAVVLLAGIAACGCSLLTIKSPEVPLSPREQEMRLLTRDYAMHFASTVIQLMDDASRATTDSGVRTEALRVKLGAVTEITRASTGLSPIVSMLDTWAFAIQFRDFFAAGAGVATVGAAGPEVRLKAADLAAAADAMAERVAGADYARYREFVDGYAAAHPLANADFVRPSVLEAWTAGRNDRNPLHSAGTVAQALGDVSDRVRIYGERAPVLGLWQAELALDRAGIDDRSYRAALRKIDNDLDRISTLADTSPALAHEAIRELRGSLHESSDRLDAAWVQLLRTVREEREALAANIASERAGLTVAFDEQRAKITADAAAIATRTVDSSWQQLRSLVREALLLAILLAIVVMGLPFAAGFLVGRRAKR